MRKNSIPLRNLDMGDVLLHLEYMKLLVKKRQKTTRVVRKKEYYVKQTTAVRKKLIGTPHTHPHTKFNTGNSC